MSTISNPLQLHLFLSGDYFAARTQRRELQRETRGAPLGTAADTRKRAQLHAARANVNAQALWAQPFVQVLGNGAQPGLVRHFSGLLAGETNGVVWADARAGSVAHPCKRNPSVSHVLKAGMAGMAACFLPGVLIGAVAGAVVQVTSLLIAIASFGLWGGSMTVGISVMLACTAAVSLAAGALAVFAAYRIIEARAAGDVETSRQWEDVSGYLALVPRFMVTLCTEPERLDDLLAPDARAARAGLA